MDGKGVRMSRTPDEIRDTSIDRFNELASMKFNAGQTEHGNCLDDTVTFAHLEEEIIDLWFYCQSMKVRMRAAERAMEARE